MTKQKPGDRSPGLTSGASGGRLPRFSPDQLLIILVIGLLVAGLALWRAFTLFR